MMDVLAPICTQCGSIVPAVCPNCGSDEGAALAQWAGNEAPVRLRLPLILTKPIHQGIAMLDEAPGDASPRRRDHMNPTIGQTVLYKLSESDAERINRRRGAKPWSDPNWSHGAQAHVGNPVSAGEVVPLVIVRVWPNEYDDAPGVNGQAILDGNDSLWVTSAREGSEPGTWHWREGKPE